MVDKEIVVRNGPVDGFAGVVRAGPLLFSAGCDGHRDSGSGAIDPALAGQGTQQTDNSYGAIKRLLEQAGSRPSAVARIDHFTSSQDWIAERQIKRAEYFGKPSPHGSTGVAAKMSGLNMLTTAVVAVVDGAQHDVLVSGADYGIAHISSLVKAGPLLFLSGIRGTLDPRSGAAIVEETNDSFATQTGICYELIRDILAKGQSATDAIVRLDRYMRNRNLASNEAAIRRSIVGDLDAVSTLVPLPMGMHGEVEITALAVADPSTKEVCLRDAQGQATVIRGGGFVFVGECRGSVGEKTGRPVAALGGDVEGQIDNTLTTLEARLAAAGSALTNVVRLEVYLRDIYQEEAFLDRARAVFADDPPAVIVTGAELEGTNEVVLNAIAV